MSETRLSEPDQDATEDPPFFREEGDYRGIAMVNRDRLAVTTLEFMHDAVMIVDENGLIVAVNPAFQAMFGLRWSQVVGEPFASAMIARTEYTQFTDTVIEAILQPEKAISRDIVVTLGDKERNLLVRTSLLLPEDEGDVHGLVAVISDETDRVKFLRTQRELAGMLLTLILSFAFSILATTAIVRNVDIAAMAGGESLEWMRISWGYLLLTALPPLVYILYTGIPLESVGVTLVNWRRAIAECAAVFVVLLIALFGVALFMNPLNGSGPFGLPLDFGSGVGIAELSYFGHSFVQEFIARGVLQTAICRVLYSRSAILGIIIAAITFSSMHAAWGLPVVFFTLVSSIIFGMLYIRHKTLIGIGLLHFALGSAMFTLQID